MKKLTTILAVLFLGTLLIAGSAMAASVKTLDLAIIDEFTLLESDPDNDGFSKKKSNITK
jgi:hypothetical protein